MARILPVASFDGVVFGATGDLTMRKLLPALFHRFRDRQFPNSSRIIAAARTELDTDAYRVRAEAALRQHVDAASLEAGLLQDFLGLVQYQTVDALGPQGWPELVATLQERPEQVRAFYLATSPELYGPICHRLAEHGGLNALSRVVLEKPIGHDLASAQAINNAVGEVLPEKQIFRIDHYLGKETVQNLMALRFANPIFERLWHADTIDHVQITVAETVGVEGRGGYYDRSGALRDMVQNHMLQLLCLLAMESPISLDTDAVRDEKLKVLRALQRVEAHEVNSCTVRGQYAAGAAEGRPVQGYLADLGAPDSLTETFVALKMQVNSWRWAGVPFYLRTGKRLPRKMSEIVVQFRTPPFSIFPRDQHELQPNRLLIRLQPAEGMRLEMMTKEPGPGGLHLKPTGLDISFEKAFGQRYPDAYERLLMDVVRGNTTLFMRRDEVEAAWGWVQPILRGWSERRDAPRPYLAGSWGPSAAIAMIERDGRTWYESTD
jgi:glucose-6-phosphate 1-dehydrogenase